MSSTKEQFYIYLYFCLYLLLILLERKGEKIAPWVTLEFFYNFINTLHERFKLVLWMTLDSDTNFFLEPFGYYPCPSTQWTWYILMGSHIGGQIFSAFPHFPIFYISLFKLPFLSVNYDLGVKIYFFYTSQKKVCNTVLEAKFFLLHFLNAISINCIGLKTRYPIKFVKTKWIAKFSRVV